MSMPGAYAAGDDAFYDECQNCEARVPKGSLQRRESWGWLMCEECIAEADAREDEEDES